MKKIMITGGCGFIGHHFVEHILNSTDWDIIIIDKLTYASKGFDRLKSFGGYLNKRVRIFTNDLCNLFEDGLKLEIGEVDYIVHMAADTHVDNSISDPVSVIKNNIMSTVSVLEYARELKHLDKFFYFSSDEVYGTAIDIPYKEWDRHRPTNPYSASKSGAENICISYYNTYNLPIIIVNVMNAFGERQHVEKFIPKCIKYILDDKEIEIHADKKCGKSGSRFYIHARNIAQSIMFLIKNGDIGEKYNVVGEKEVNNLEMAQYIAKILDKNLKYKMVNFYESRPYYDLRYSLDGQKMFDMGWKLPVNFYESLEKTIKWTVNNKEWINE